jgi:murein DD-endopeptidase MepM/ murein hydrolase activator NlpD
MRDAYVGRRPPRRRGRFLLFGVVSFATATAAAWVLYLGVSPPTARLTRPTERLGRITPLEVELVSGRAGLRSYEIAVRRADGSLMTVDRKLFPGGGLLGSGQRRFTAAIEIDAREIEVGEGRVDLLVFAEDHSPLNLMRRRNPVLELPLQVDLTPPALRSLGEGPPRIIASGGSDLALYEVDEDAARSGVEIGTRTFPGAAVSGLPPTTRAALYAIAHDTDDSAVPRLFAEDDVGNRRTVDLHVNLRVKSFPAEDIVISEEFIRGKILPLLESSKLSAPKDLLQSFLLVNRNVRQTSETKVSELTGVASPDLKLDGAFRQQPGTHVGSRFAEHRTYRYNGNVIDRQNHLGYDLASVKQAPVLAAQAGTVKAAEEIGIYGRAVVLDHGLGLHSLYAHLSGVDVAVGDEVALGQQLGRTGESGLAAGDHLHFSILVHGVHVDPIEWWDPKWVRLHVLEPLGHLRGGEPTIATQAATEHPSGAAATPGKAAGSPG